MDGVIVGILRVWDALNPYSANVENMVSS